MILCTFEWWLLPSAHWPLSFHFATFPRTPTRPFASRASELSSFRPSPLSLLCFSFKHTKHWAWYPLKYYFSFLPSHHQMLWRLRGGWAGSGPSSKRQAWLGGWRNWNWPHSLRLRMLSAHFIFGLNFIAKVFHNQNFMLAPPLSLSLSLKREPRQLCLFGLCLLYETELKSLNLLSPSSSFAVLRNGRRECFQLFFSLSARLGWLEEKSGLA